VKHKMNDRNSILGLLISLALIASSEATSEIRYPFPERKTKKCRKCGKEFFPKRYGHYLCYDCFETMKQNGQDNLN